MITVNLLTKEKQREHTLRTLFYPIKSVLELALFLALCLAIVMISTRLFLLKTLVTFATGTTTAVHTRELERAIRRTNQITAILDRLQRENRTMSAPLMTITDSIPPGVTVSELTVRTKQSPNLLLKGKAAARTDLLTLKTRLEKTPAIKNLSFPLANLLSPKDILWQLEADFAPQTP